MNVYTISSLSCDIAAQKLHHGSDFCCTDPRPKGSVPEWTCTQTSTGRDAEFHGPADAAHSMYCACHCEYQSCDDICGNETLYKSLLCQENEGRRLYVVGLTLSILILTWVYRSYDCFFGMQNFRHYMRQILSKTPDTIRRLHLHLHQMLYIPRRLYPPVEHSRQGHSWIPESKIGPPNAHSAT